MESSRIEHDVHVVAGAVSLPGTLIVPSGCCGLVVFAHGSDSSRLSPRNRAVAGTLVERGCATLLFDLLTPREALDRRNVFDIDLLGRRVTGAMEWLRHAELAPDVPIGYFGASTGAAAALVAAADRTAPAAAVVSRGGRPDLAAHVLASVSTPTLLIVGSLDHDVLRLNEQARVRLGGESELLVIEGATHLFEEPGTLDAVAEAAGDWFVDHFARTHSASAR